MERIIKFRAWDIKGKQMYPNIQNQICDPQFAFGHMLNRSDRFKIMQFTSLLDKNGKEIYEGDILEYHVIFKDRKLVSIKNGCTYIGEWDCISTNSHDHFEIVGNIYENPKLLNL